MKEGREEVNEKEDFIARRKIKRNERKENRKERMEERR